MSLLLDFKDNWLKKHFAPSGQKVLLAVSGGVDSMVMAHLCLSTGVSFGIAHCNFQLRGTESDLDESLVRDWAVRNGITFHHMRFETKQRMEEWKKGVQETARILRYEWLDMICKEHGYSFLATAHHAGDNVETLLMNLFKGTGITGLHGIPERNGNVIRPLLFASKDSVLEYAQDHKVPYRDDASNSTDVYQRNAIRNKIIPAIAEFFPGVTGHINDSISRFAQAETLYKEAVAQHIKKLVEKRGQDYYIPVLKLKKEAVPETMCYEMFSPYGFSAAQLPHIMQLMDAETGRYISSDTHRIIRNRDFLILTASPVGATDLVVVEGVPCEVNVGSHHFTFTIEDKPAVIPANQNAAYLDMKNIEFPILLRKWKLGDYFYPFGMGMKKKKISRYLIDQKVPLHEKEHVWLLECNKRIAWLAGMRPDERFKVKESTVKVLVCSIKDTKE